MEKKDTKNAKNIKLKRAIVTVSAAAALTGAIYAGDQYAEKKDKEVIYNGVMEICGDHDHADKVIDYYDFQMSSGQQPMSAKQLVRRHKEICPGHGIDYPSVVDKKREKHNHDEVKEKN